MTEKKIIRVGSITAMPTQWSVGKIVEKFLDGLIEGKINGIKCGSCGKVYAPPQQVCGDCFKEMDQWLELSGEGEVLNYTVAHVDVRNQALSEPKVIGLIKLDGSDTAIFGVIKGMEPGPDLIGSRIKAVLRDQRKGNIRDISHYEAV